jgi:hypothetical protein
VLPPTFRAASNVAAPTTRKVLFTVAVVVVRAGVVTEVVALRVVDVRAVVEVPCNEVAPDTVNDDADKTPAVVGPFIVVTFNVGMLPVRAVTFPVNVPFAADRLPVIVSVSADTVLSVAVVVEDRDPVCTDAADNKPVRVNEDPVIALRVASPVAVRGPVDTDPEDSPPVRVDDAAFIAPVKLAVPPVSVVIAADVAVSDVSVVAAKFVVPAIVRLA